MGSPQAQAKCSICSSIVQAIHDIYHFCSTDETKVRKLNHDKIYFASKNHNITDVASKEHMTSNKFHVE